MKYIELNDELKEKVKSQDLSGSGMDFVRVITKNGIRYSATLLNEKRLKVNESLDEEDIENIEAR